MDKNLYLQAIARKCMQEIDSMDILYSRHIEFKVNTRAKSRFGICRHKASGLDIIEIMEDLVDPSKLKPLKETIIHEVLHTCDKCQNHGIL